MEKVMEILLMVAAIIFGFGVVVGIGQYFF